MQRGYASVRESETRRGSEREENNAAPAVARRMERDDRRDKEGTQAKQGAAARVRRRKSDTVAAERHCAPDGGTRTARIDWRASRDPHHDAFAFTQWGLTFALARVRRHGSRHAVVAGTLSEWCTLRASERFSWWARPSRRENRKKRKTEREE